MVRWILLAAISLAFTSAFGFECALAQSMPGGVRHHADGDFDLVALNNDAAEFDWLDGADHASAYQNVHQPIHSLCKGWYAGVELVMVKPYWEDEVDTFRQSLDPSDPEFDIVQTLDPNYSCSLSPRIYVGYRNCDGFGARVRYWFYNEAANPLEEDRREDEGRIYFYNAALKVQALDLEATKRLADGTFSLELSGGARYGKTAIRASQIQQNFSNGFLDSVVSYTGQARFEGVGPTISAEARHQIGHSHFAFVGNIRGSLLFGQSQFSARLTGPDLQVVTGNKGRNDLVPIIESQIGAEYVRIVGRGRLSARAMMEAQWWGISTPGGSFPLDLPILPLASEGDIFNTDRDLGFFGVTAAIIYEF
jgi:hypothetical protein